MIKHLMRVLFGKKVIAGARAIRGPGYGAHGDYQNQNWYN